MKWYHIIVLSLSFYSYNATAEEPQDTTSLSPENLTGALFYGIAEGNMATIQGSLQQGANPNTPFGERGDTPLIYSIRALIDLISKFQQHIFVDQATFQTAYFHRLGIVRFLTFLDQTKVTLKNRAGQTALDLAVQSGLDSVQELIIQKMRMSTLTVGQDHELYLQKLETLDLPERTKAKIKEEIEKLSGSIHPAEAGKQNEFLKFLFDLPWNTSTQDNNNLREVHAALDEDHYGLEKIKDRVLEYLAVKKISNNPKTPILCFVGPPGTGKTSIAKSIARGLDKNFARVSLGGIHEERAIRGHNKAYIGSEAGDILKAIKTAQSNNPVILLDEIDKLATNNTWHGNPAAALLEVLDSEQNHDFVDHYLDVPFDLSQIIFIATANSLWDIDPVLRDRLEIIEFSSYTYDEKFHIAQDYVIPQVLKDTGLADKGLMISDDVLQEVILKYAHSTGVRRLEQMINKLCSKAALYLEENGTLPVFTVDNISDYLGVGYDMDLEKTFMTDNRVGVANGLHTSALGGAIGTFEAQHAPGKGNIKITGNMVNSCLDSANVAAHFIRTHAAELGIETDFIDTHDIFIHSPTASSKDGNSAGITMTTAIVSAITNKPVDISFAMTGEVTLTGRVFPIGGVKEKILGAKRIGITKIILPEANRPHYEECKDVIGDDVEVFFVTDVRQVFDLVLLPN